MQKRLQCSLQSTLQTCGTERLTDDFTINGAEYVKFVFRVALLEGSGIIKRVYSVNPFYYAVKFAGFKGVNFTPLKPANFTAVCLLDYIVHYLDIIGWLRKEQDLKLKGFVLLGA